MSHKSIIYYDKDEFSSLEKEDRFIFFMKSAQKKAGKGFSEFASTSYDLPTDFRQILSNFFVEEGSTFEYGGFRWRSVEHAFQAYKFKDVNYDLFKSFTFDSGSELGTLGSGLDAQKKRKAVVLNSIQLQEWNRKKDGLMAELWRAKFSQIERLKNVLIATKDAQLWHTVVRSSVKQHWIGLERIRDELM